MLVFSPLLDATLPPWALMQLQVRASESVNSDWLLVSVPGEALDWGSAGVANPRLQAM
jgi:hypothetical protein